MVRTINFDIVKPEDRAGEYEYDSLVIPPGCFTYDGIVSLLIRYKYPDDKMAAIQNNYLATLGKTTPEAVAASDEFSEMQTWRNSAKKIAREALSRIE